MDVTANSIRLTDPALEFATLAHRLRVNSQNSNVAACEILAKFVGLSSNDYQFVEMLGILGVRANILMEFIAGIKDDYLDDDLRNAVINGVGRMSLVTKPSNMAAPWSQVVSQSLREDDIRLLRSFSRTARDHRALRLLSDADKKHLIEQIDASLTELVDDKHFPKWAINPITDGMRRLKLIMMFFDVFGHDAAIDQLLKVEAEVRASFDFMLKISEISQHKLVKTIGVFSLATNVLLLPPKIVDAIPSYRGYVHAISENVPKLIGGPLKQITDQRIKQVDPEAPADAD
ncbi:hypothetical protein MKK84_06915 [Methylobacterium sp. E-065]|uniref:hypothetical protein n=1 Tax=Methylobacterium sp. E-065 TaxID=2836583 RepID=UPI001FBBF8F4|nr:hypothetical protein [Methylobacterium sp. E-065]MCJ2017154.1 hypothetical protein [Methylobacterium sp. E-065]